MRYPFITLLVLLLLPVAIVTQSIAGPTGPRVAAKPPPVATPKATPAEQAEAICGGELPVCPDGTGPFAPDVFPTQQAALRFAARQVIESLKGAPAGDKPASEACKRIVITSDLGVYTDGLNEIGEMLRTDLGAMDYLLDIRDSSVIRSTDGIRMSASSSSGTAAMSTGDATTSPTDAETLQFRVRLSESSISTPSWWPTGLSSGALTISMPRRASGAPISSARFIEKPWVDDPQGFALAQNGQRWIIGASPDVVAASADATRAATRNAAAALLPLLKAHIARSHVKITPPPEFSIDNVATQLTDRRMVSDQFLQRFQRPYGSVWQGAVLVNASDANVESIVRSITATSTARLVMKATGFGSFIAFSCVLVLLYAFLNSATKGYFAGRLKAAMILLMIVGIFVVVAAVK